MPEALNNRPLLVRLEARIQKYQGCTTSPLVTDIALHQQSVDEIARLSETVAALSKNVIEMSQQDLNVSVDNLRRHGLSIDGDNAYKRDLCDSIVGAMVCGAQNRNPPPPGQWQQRFWDIGRGEAAAREELVAALKLTRENLRACQGTIHLAGGFDPAYVNDAQAAMKIADAALAKFAQ